MITGQKRKLKKKKYESFLSSQIPKLFHLKKKFSSKSILPPINQNKEKNNDLITQIKKSSISKSINLLYKSFFPDQKTNLNNFLINYSNKHIKKQTWKYSITKSRSDDNIRKEVMEKNKTMRSYEYMRKPCKLNQIRVFKPRMIQIIENNDNYKYRYLINPWKEEYDSYRKNKNKSLHNFYKFSNDYNFF